MRVLDWLVLVGSIVAAAAYGMVRSRRANTTHQYLLAGKSMSWPVMAFSIMATQASAITFISTTGQSYVDGMRFVQFYFGLPLAMIILSATAVPLFHRARVYTAYEYLEQRFDAKTRALVSVIFLIQRGLAIGVALYAPAIVLTVILGWPDTLTPIIMGVVAILYTTLGGAKAVAWTEFPQMIIMWLGLFAAVVAATVALPGDMGLGEALTVAGAAGKLNPVVFQFSWQDRYNVWSGLLGGMFLALAYFGCDQSQVQRYLTGRSITQSRLSLLFNGVAKVPMQFFILLVGVIVFAFYTFVPAPLLFHPIEYKRVEQVAPERFRQVQHAYEQAFAERRQAAQQLLQARRQGNQAAYDQALHRFRQAQAKLQDTREQAFRLVEQSGGSRNFNDTNYIFLSFVTRYLPAGVVGLILAAIFGAAMSSISSEINSLATVTVIDLYKRHWRPHASDGHYVRVARWATVFWGAYAVLTAEFGRHLGALIEAVNILGSLFYGGLLGVFALAFLFKGVGGTPAFLGVIAGEIAIFAAALFSEISFLWYNVIGCGVVILTALLLNWVQPSWRRRVS